MIIAESSMLDISLCLSTSSSAGVAWKEGVGPRLQLRRSPRSGKETKFLRPTHSSARKWIETTAKEERGKIPSLIAVTSAIDFRIGNIAEVEEVVDSDATVDMTPEPNGPTHIVSHGGEGIHIPRLDITQGPARTLDMFDGGGPAIKQEEGSVH
jgi:hypothetical protein